MVIENESGDTEMPKNEKPVAKSLHTITVIVQVARLHKTINSHAAASNESAITLAMVTLGLAGRADPYGLAAAAAKQL
jgi:hypothetical protein